MLIRPIRICLEHVKLLRVDEIEVNQVNESGDAILQCAGSATCLPTLPSNDKNCYINEDYAGTTMSTFDQLIDYIVGGCNCGTDKYAGTDGWYIQFPHGERNLGQATLFGGLVTLTSYLPEATCTGIGESYIYALYYQTGTAWTSSIYQSPGGLKGNIVVSKQALGPRTCPYTESACQRRQS